MLTISPMTAGPILPSRLPVPIHEDRFSFRGNQYRVAHSVCEAQDPSWFSFHDESDVRERDWDVRPGDLVLDVGAAFGSYALAALSAGAGHVWAWSPQAYPVSGISEADYLRMSAEINGWGDRLTVVPGGAYSRDGWLDCLTQEFHETRPDVPRDANDLLEVRTLDSWRDSLQAPFQRLEWMKLDVEGAEAAVLEGARGILTDLRPRVQVELHRFKDGDTVRAVGSLMESLGYDCLHIIPHHGVSHGVYVPRA